MALRPDTVHLWRAHLSPAQHPVERFEAILTIEERARAERFLFERDRTRFVIARGLLRSILGAYLGADPREVVIQTGPQGKPELGAPHAGALHFNVSHSCQLGLFAFARCHAVGVDLEHLRPLPYIEALASSVLADEELAHFQSLPPHERVSALLTAWTRKEAVLKALGRGLNISPREVQVRLSPGRPAAVHGLAGEMHERIWTVLDPHVPSGYFAALASRTSGIELVEREWESETISE
jgi:4'-phosphopantetheinyl transferase